MKSGIIPNPKFLKVGIQMVPTIQHPEKQMAAILVRFLIVGTIVKSRPLENRAFENLFEICTCLGFLIPTKYIALKNLFVNLIFSGIIG